MYLTRLTLYYRIKLQKSGGNFPELLQVAFLKKCYITSDTYFQSCFNFEIVKGDLMYVRLAIIFIVIPAKAGIYINMDPGSSPG